MTRPHKQTMSFIYVVYYDNGYCGLAPRYVSHSVENVKQNLIQFCTEEGYNDEGRATELTMICTALKHMNVVRMKLDGDESCGLGLADFFPQKRTYQQIIESMNELKINTYLTIIKDALLTNGPIHAIIRRYEESFDEETFKRDIFQLCNPYARGSSRVNV